MLEVGAVLEAEVMLEAEAMFGEGVNEAAMFENRKRKG